MDRLNAQFVSKGGLAFDIGAHLGDRTGSFLRLGARVVTVEPQPNMFRALQLLYGGCKEASLLQSALGASAGEMTFYVNSANPTISTGSLALVDAARGAIGWREQSWDDALRVPVTTLETLIARHGMPDFTKIDVEGFELDVLRGLDRPLPALSFELTTIQREVALDCVARLLDLGRYEFNFSLGEEHMLQHDAWLSPDAICHYISDLPDDANSGDIYARLT
ncbi:FkbM family methyltransferase [Hasllibacter sp. MH4015]|uniref:FkbM family methyltransferase n=1 Tax=Hasllibacter sp. MH4015 TaxID=2854029 RepID=UPI001CD3B887|nr:FkbM family methyltransferase [Hasllibacter sp. MH4015]